MRATHGDLNDRLSVQDVETKAAERQREVAEQWEAQLGAAKAAAGAK
eukprot:COSAG01_NODE_42706_length_437_cov_1.068047_1_plen_46_part_10